MAPGGGGKRKRGDRSYSGDSREDGSRPSPHRPDGLSLGQRTQQSFQQPQTYGRGGYNDRGRGSRRGSRGGPPGGSQRSPLQSPNVTSQQPSPVITLPRPPSPRNAQTTASADPKQPMELSSSQPAAKLEEQEELKKKMLAYNYEHMRDEIVDAWADTGRKHFLSKGAQACEAKDSLTLGNMFQELLQAGVDGRISASEAGSVIKEIVGQPEDRDELNDVTAEDLAFDSSSLFLDTLSIFAEATEPLPPPLIPLVHATGTSAPKMRRELDSSLLEHLGLIRSTFVRVGIRQQTNLLYRQSNYNLLREETEGYSKLVTEFFTTSSNEPPTSEVVEETFERVKGMIGSFDLDVGRVLDITLDVFAAVLVKQYRFFVKYLRASSWWPQDSHTKDVEAQYSLGSLPRWALPGFEGRVMTTEERDKSDEVRTERDIAFWQRCREIGLPAFFEIGGRRAEGPLLEAVTSELISSNTSESNEDRQWIELTRTLPPTGNKTAAQVLGFKLRFYNSTARDSTDIFPVNLIFLAALLIKIGFITLRDLYPHIWPEDSAMEKVRDEKMKEKLEREKQNRPGGGTNALLAAAPLPDDTIEGQVREATRLREADAARRHQKTELPTGRSTPIAQPEDKPDELPEPADQKVQLLKSLLCIGALPEALYMLGRFPWLPDAFPDLPEYIHRILHHCLSKLYEPRRPLKDEASLQEQQKMPDADQIGVSKGKVRLADMPPRRTMRWAQLDKDDTSEAVDYRFYWDDWADVIPVCQDVDDLFTLCSTLLNFSGVKIGQDPTLLLKLSRIGSHSLSSDPSKANTIRWIDLSKRLLVPALSLTKCNPGVVNEVFELIKHFPDSTRYNIYAEWYNGQISRLPDIKSAFEQTKAETRDVLKRISKTTIKPMARALAKVTYASPGIVFSVAISQLEAYENIVDTFVECARYFTYLAYDVLTWSLMSALGAQGRNRLQADGMLTSRWLAALSLFAGKVFKRYSVMNPLPIVQYVEDQLRQGNSTDLIVLENITRSMAGIISDVSFNESQVVAMGGGALMQSQTLQQLLDRRHESKSTAKRLIKPLTDSRMAGQVLVSLAQERQTCIFRIEEQNAHPKLLGNLFDQIHRILGQYLDLLRSNLSIKDFDYFVPDVAKLIGVFGIEPSVAFWICRPSIAAAISEHDSKVAKHTSDAKKAAIKDDEKKDDAPQAGIETYTEGNPSEVASEDKMEVTQSQSNGQGVSLDTDAGMTAANGDAKAVVIEESPNVESIELQQRCHPVLQTIANNIQTTLPTEIWDSLNPSFYTTFWQLSLGDVFTTLQPYDDETKRLTNKIKAITADRSDISIAGTQKKNREKATIQDLVDSLHAEMKERVALKQAVRLKKEKDHWFAGSWGRYDALNLALIEYCFFPRLVMSPVDSLYAFRMIKWLHREGATNFRTMGIYDQFFREKRLTSMIFLCSAKEAECLGRFINDVLRDLSLWHADKAIYEKEAYGAKKNLPGFSRSMKTEKEVGMFLEYEDFRRILLKWHRNLNGALKTCYASGEYMHIRNAINILNNVHQYFPAINWMGSNQLASITELSKNESREDLKIAATSLIGALKKREKNWVLPQAFNLIEGNQGGVNGTRATPARSSTPKSSNAVTKPLNPKASDFKPSSQPIVNGNVSSAKTNSVKIDAEDGEIDDVQSADPTSKSDAKLTPAAKVDQSGPPPVDQRPTQPTALSEMTPAQTTTPSQMSDTSAPVIPNTAGQRPTSLTQPSKPASIPNRPDINRNSSSTLLNGHHELPTRPEGPQFRRADARISTRPEDRLTQTHPRDSRMPSRGVQDGQRDLPGGRGLERNAPGPPLRNSVQADERSGRPGHDDAYSRALPRDARALPSDDRSGRLPPSRPIPDLDHGRRDFNSGQHGRESGMLPPRSTIPQHPDRAALIHGAPESSRDQHPRYPERPSLAAHERHSRGPSPTRPEERSSMYERNRPLQDSRHPYDDRLSHGRYEDSHAPTGPRNDRPPMGPPNVSTDHGRDTVRPSPSTGPPIDSNHGRLRQEPPMNRQSESYGRLNSGSDVPLGPRLANGNAQGPPRGVRNPSASQSSLPSQQPTQAIQRPASPPQSRATPSGPALRNSSRNRPPTTQSSSTPSTPISQGPEVAGIHPDRLKAIQGVGPAQINTGPPSQSAARQPPSPVASLPVGPPRGPQSQLPNPVLPPPLNRGPPTGPADRSRSDKRFTSLQSVLQQSDQNGPDRSNSQGTSIRGRGARPSNVPSPSTSGPPTPSALRPEIFPNRDDLFAGRSNGQIGPPSNEEAARYGRGGRHGPPELERRSGRHRSRSPGKDRPADGRMRDGDRPPPREDPRDRFRTEAPPMNIRGNAGPELRGPLPDMEHDLRGGPLRRGGRDDMPPREADRRDIQEWNGDRRGGPGRRGDERDSRDGSGSMRKRGRPGDEGFGDRNMDSKRPRR